MNLSFQEKSLWLMLVSVGGSFGFYFATVLPGHSANVRPHQVIVFVVTVVLLAILSTVGHVLIALVDRRSEDDERGRLIALKGTRNGSYVLATGVALALCAAVFTSGNFIFTHVLLGFWVLAQLVEIVSQLHLHRRGA